MTVETRSRQTKGPTAERAATPQYRNAGAYEILGGAVFPWSLPFDLSVAETDVYFGHLGIRRAVLLETVLPGTREQILGNVVLGHVSLGLSSTEAGIVTGAIALPTLAGRLSHRGAAHSACRPMRVSGPTRMRRKRLSVVKCSM